MRHTSSPIEGESGAREIWCLLLLSITVSAFDDAIGMELKTLFQNGAFRFLYKILCIFFYLHGNMMSFNWPTM